LDFKLQLLERRLEKRQNGARLVRRWKHFSTCKQNRVGREQNGQFQLHADANQPQNGCFKPLEAELGVQELQLEICGRLQISDHHDSTAQVQRDPEEDFPLQGTQRNAHRA
jgi:hypothetical protein